MTAATLAVPRMPRNQRRAPCAGADARETERLLLVRYHELGDLAAREKLVERFLPLARDLALRYTYTDEPFDDLLQVASLGLIKAIDGFKPGRGTKFTSYAAPTILGELKRHFRDKGWSLHVPRDLQERSLAVSRATEGLSKELGRSPKVREVAEHLGCSGSRCSRRRRPPPATRPPRWTRRQPATTTSPRRWWSCSAARTRPTSSSRTAEAIASTWHTLPGRRAQGRRAALHARPHPARDRRTDRLLANARLTTTATRDRAVSRQPRQRRERERVVHGEALPVVVEVDEAPRPGGATR